MPRSGSPGGRSCCLVQGSHCVDHPGHEGRRRWPGGQPCSSSAYDQRARDRDGLLGVAARLPARRDGCARPARSGRRPSWHPAGCTRRNPPSSRRSLPPRGFGYLAPAGGRLRRAEVVLGLVDGTVIATVIVPSAPGRMSARAVRPPGWSVSRTAAYRPGPRSAVRTLVIMYQSAAGGSAWPARTAPPGQRGSHRNPAGAACSSIPNDSAHDRPRPSVPERALRPIIWVALAWVKPAGCGMSGLPGVDPGRARSSKG
jgi:hypothetical protein